MGVVPGRSPKHQLDWLGRQTGMLEIFFLGPGFAPFSGWSWGFSMLWSWCLSSSARPELVHRAGLHEDYRLAARSFSVISLSISRAFSSTLRRVVMQELSTSVWCRKMGVERYRMPTSSTSACSRRSSGSSGLFLDGKTMDFANVSKDDFQVLSCRSS